MSNPAFSESMIGSSNWYDAASSKTFTAQGAAFKTLVLLAIMSATFIYTWIEATAGYSTAFQQAASQNLPAAISIPQNVIGLAAAGVIGAFVVSMIVIFNQRSAPILAPIYAGLEGLALGAISAGFEARYPGIVMEAMTGVLGTTAIMAVIYSSGLLRPTEGFVTGLLAAMGGILMLYLADIIMQYFGGTSIEIVHGNSMMSIGLQVFIVGIAALNLIIDFGTITEAAENRAPKWYEWYAAFGLMVTIVWLYLEMLKLLAKLKSSDD